MLYKHALSRELDDFTPLFPRGWITPTRFLLFARRTIHTQLITSRCSLGLCSHPNRRSVILSALVARYLSFLPFLVFSAGGLIRSLVYAAHNTYAPNSFFLSGGSGFLVVCVSRVLLHLCFSPFPNAVNSSLLSSGLFPTGGLGLSRSASVVCYSARVSCPSYRARLSLFISFVAMDASCVVL